MSEYVGGKKGFILRALPSRYPMTDQQKKLRDVAKECGIVKGITKKELQQRMKDCVGPKMRGEEMNKKEAWNPKLTEEEEKEYLEKGWIG